MGLVSAFVATYANTATTAPVYLCAALYICMVSLVNNLHVLMLVLMITGYCCRADAIRALWQEVYVKHLIPTEGTSIRPYVEFPAAMGSRLLYRQLKCLSPTARQGVQSRAAIAGSSALLDTLAHACQSAEMLCRCSAPSRLRIAS